MLSSISVFFPIPSSRPAVTRGVQPHSAKQSGRYVLVIEISLMRVYRVRVREFGGLIQKRNPVDLVRSCSCGRRVEKWAHPMCCPQTACQHQLRFLPLLFLVSSSPSPLRIVFLRSEIPLIECSSVYLCVSETRTPALISPQLSPHLLLSQFGRGYKYALFARSFPPSSSLSLSRSRLLPSSRPSTSTFFPSNFNFNTNTTPLSLRPLLESSTPSFIKTHPSLPQSVCLFDSVFPVVDIFKRISLGNQ